MSDKQIGIQIKKARSEKTMSQETLGEKLGVTWEMISRYENGRSSARKYLSELSEIFDKPISYFFGVEDDLIKYNVEKIVSALKEKGVSYEAGPVNKVVLIDDFSILGFEKSLKLTRQFYSAPQWIIEKYPDIFALRLRSLSGTGKGVDIGEGDIGFFSPSAKPAKDDHVLIKEGNVFKLAKYLPNPKGEILAVLVAQERRFR